MLDDQEYIEVEEDELPSDLTDQKILDLAKHFEDEFLAFDRPRYALAREIWPACDRIYMAIKDDFELPTMKNIDNGVLGSSEGRTAVKTARNQIINGTIPADGSWLEPARDGSDDENTNKNIRDMMLCKLDEAGIREVMPITIDQYLARGSTAIGLRWDTRRLVRRLNKTLASHLDDLAEQMGATDVDGNALKKAATAPIWHTIFDGPIVYPIDMHRLWLDPAEQLNKDSSPSYIHVVFKTMSDLKGARNGRGERLYDEGALEEVDEWTYAEWYRKFPWMCHSTKFMGVDPGIEESGKFVPVYLFYRQIRYVEDNDETYVDKLFYVARGQNGHWTIIRIQDNPHPFGHPPFFYANCDSWLNTPYGTGILEKSLSDIKTLNIMRTLGLNFDAISRFPPMFYISGILKDDKKPRLMPGGFTEIINRPGVGLQWMAPFPFNPQVNSFNAENETLVSKRILDQTGVTTAGAITSADNSPSKERTAAEIKQEASENMGSSQVHVDKLNSQMMQPFAQASYDYIRANASNSTSGVEYTHNDKRTGKPTTGVIPPSVMDKDRKIKIVGRRGLATESQKIGNLTEVIKILSNPAAAQVIQNLPAMLSDVMIQLISLLGVSIKPEWEMPPEQLFAKDPKVQQAAMMDVLQDPEKVQALVQMLMSTPQGQQTIKEIEQVAHDRGMQHGIAAAQTAQRPPKQPKPAGRPSTKPPMQPQAPPAAAPPQPAPAPQPQLIPQG